MAKNYITQNEIDGNVKPELLEVTNRYIRFLRSVLNITSMAGGVHSKNSYHYKGIAEDDQKGKFKEDREPTEEDIQFAFLRMIDLFNKPNKNLLEQAICKYLAGFNGIGIYPHWYPVSGSHGDLRPEHKAVAWIGQNVEKVQSILKQIEEKNRAIIKENESLPEGKKKPLQTQFYIYF
jgi:hypothetical protein